jgi:hypothetical protein
VYDGITIRDYLKVYDKRLSRNQAEIVVDEHKVHLIRHGINTMFYLGSTGNTRVLTKRPYAVCSMTRSVQAKRVIEEKCPYILVASEKSTIANHVSPIGTRR